MTTVTIREGVWTPWAGVLCAKHANAHWLDTSVKLDAPGENEALTTCDTCNVSISIDAKVAAEHNLVRALRQAGLNASMHQTGGMCSAAGIDLDATGDDHLLLTDSEDRDTCGEAFFVGYFPYASDPETGGVGLGDVETANVEAFVRDIVDRYNAGQRTFAGEEW